MPQKLPNVTYIQVPVIMEITTLLCLPKKLPNVMHTMVSVMLPASKAPKRYVYTCFGDCGNDHFTLCLANPSKTNEITTYVTFPLLKQVK